MESEIRTRIERDGTNDDEQEVMCRLCEVNIIGGSCNTQHYQCEGSHCNQAMEYLIDHLEDQEEPAPKLRYQMKLK